MARRLPARTQRISQRQIRRPGGLTSQALDWIKRGLAEPTAITWARQELARKLHREGVPVTAIEEKLGASTEQVQHWISLDSKPNPVIEAYRRGLLIR